MGVSMITTFPDGKTEAQKLCDLPKATQLVNGKPRI